MCGRYALHSHPDVLRLHFGLDALPALKPRYNVCPGTEILAISAGRRARLVRWGRIANARGETVAQKPAFAAAFRQWRCLVPASGFYEWQSAGGRKQPYYVVPKDAPLFALAAMVLLWKGERSVTLITTAANALMRDIHERMPVIVAPEHYPAWLDAANHEAGSMVRPYPCERMDAYPVSPRVNRPEHDDAALIEGLTAR